MALNTQLVSLRLFLPLRQISHVCALKTPPLPFPVRHPMSEENTCFLVNLFLFVVAGANQKSSSHFHCLKCDYYCTDTNKVRRECIFCAYSLVLQCNIVTHVARQQKVREGKRQRKDEDKLHFANWNWKLKQISPGGGAQEAASKAGQHHGCRWFSIFPRSSALLPIFCYSRILSIQALKSSHQRNTVQRLGAVTMGSKPTTTAGEHYYFFRNEKSNSFYH